MSFDGAGVTTDQIKVGPMEITVPKGIKIPDETLVTEATMSSVMMIEEDPTAVVKSVTESAKEAGYEEYARPNDTTWIFVGHGNAIMFQGFPQAQILTWGPETMKDVLAKGQS